MLSTPIEKLPRLSAPHKEAFKKLHIHTYGDLLYHFPTRYTDLTTIKNIGHLESGDEVTVYGTLSGLRIKPGFGTSPSSTEGTLSDNSGSIKIVWYSQPYIAKMYSEGTPLKISGTVLSKKSGLYIANPLISNTKNLPVDSHDSLFSVESAVENTEVFLQPTYNESKGITSLFIYTSIKKLIQLGALESIEDPLPLEIRQKYSLPELKESLLYMHFPKTAAHTVVAKKRFAFEEIFYIQLERARERDSLTHMSGFQIVPDLEKIDEFVASFPYTLTEAQERTIETIFEDFSTGVPASRLIEGDVGSGKTAVAAVAAYAAVTTRPYLHGEQKRQDFGTLQVAYMAPTEILAKQHFESFMEYFRDTGLSVGLITGSGCYKFPSKSSIGRAAATTISRAQLSKWVANGEIAVVIGTHALIQKNVAFKHLALCIIDEQHRFGVKQRRALVQKRGSAGVDVVPHLLSMTATPIPRTLALTIYGDLDLSVLDQMPAGRKTILTEIVTPLTRENMYEKAKEQLDAGRQLYVICPRIDEPDETKEKSLQAKAVMTEAGRLQETVFKKYTIDVVHSKMKPVEKDAAMRAFAEGSTQILVATSVVEVGVSVANASVMIIEGADRFGLSQLHQLRGRVVRGTHQPYCFVCSEGTNEKTVQRLRALTTAKNGFELAEADLLMRGAGGLTAGKQWGMSDIAMEAIKNIKLVEAARTEARKLIQEDRDLTDHPILSKKLKERDSTHLE